MNSHIQFTAEQMDEILNSNLTTDIVCAYLDAFAINYEDTTIEDIEESYSGSYNSDEEFARDMAEQCGYEIPNTWPHRCIDWEYAARELMFDYAEQNGYYFRCC